MGARWCAGFVFGESNTSACPPDATKIVSEAACASAAGVLGRPYTRTVSTADYPSGCYIANDDVYFNDHPTGRPRDSTRPLCARAPGTASCARARVNLCVRVCSLDVPVCVRVSVCARASVHACVCMCVCV